MHGWSRTRAYIHKNCYEYAAACGEIALSGLDMREDRLWSSFNFVIMKNLIIEEICYVRILTVSREYSIVNSCMEIKVCSTFWSKWS